jgi:hypothetical protein
MPVPTATILTPASRPSAPLSLKLEGGDRQDDLITESINVPNPTTYLPALKAPPHPKPSLASLDTALKSLETLYLVEYFEGGHDLPRRVALNPVEQAWEDELSRVRNDEFETDWVKGWLMRWVAYGSEWLEELAGNEEDGDEDEDEDESESTQGEEGDVLDAVEREERKRVEKFVELAAAVLAVLSGTGGMFLSFFPPKSRT